METLGRRSHLSALLLSVSMLVLLACSGGSKTALDRSCQAVESAASATSAPIGQSAASPTDAPESELSVVVISTDLCIGPNRLAFALLDGESGPVTTPEADISLYLPTEPQDEPKAVVKARFRRWPLAGLGVYTTRVHFDRAGTWGIRATVTGPDGSTRLGHGELTVKQESATPPLGSTAPRSKSKTSRDVGTLEELTTALPPDPELYSLTIADAVSSGKPLVVVFATPAFCRTATCGPQVGVVAEIKERYRGRINFIHVEMFDNPQEIQGDLTRARVSPTVEEWGLLTEPWTFIVDGQGRIAAKFEAFTTAEEIEEELRAVLQ